MKVFEKVEEEKMSRDSKNSMIINHTQGKAADRLEEGLSLI